jgi:salicylate hydroxylase
LTADTTQEQVTERLRMYNDVRYDHAVTVMFLSRVGDELQEAVMGDLRRFVPNAKMPEDMFRYAWASYPTKDAEGMLASGSK